MNDLIQEKWRNGYVIGHDCLAFGGGGVVIANTYTVYDPNTGETKCYWNPLCDTTLDGITKYDEDIWSAIDIFHGAFTFENETFVFGPGAMGNEGYVASVAADNALNWSMFFTFSNPIMKAETIGRQLVCHGETGVEIRISLDRLTSVSVALRSD